MRSSPPLRRPLFGPTVLPLVLSGTVLAGASLPAEIRAQDGPPWLDVAQGWELVVPGTARPGTFDLSGSWRDLGIEALLDLRLRRTVELPPTLVRRGELAVLVGPGAPGWYELRADGRLIGSAGSRDAPLPYPRVRLFPVPDRALEDGRLELELALHRVPALEGALDGGPAGGSILVGDRRSLAARVDLLRSRRLLADAPALALVILFLAVGVYHLLLYRTRPGERAFLWFGLGTLAIAGNVWFNSTWFTTYAAGYGLPYRLGDTAGHLAIAAFVPFLWDILERSTGPWIRGYALSHLGLALFVAAAPFTWVTASAELRFLWLVPGFVAALRVLLASEGRIEARILLLGGAVLVATEALELGRLLGLDTPPGLPYAGVGAAVLAMAIALAERFRRTYDELDTLRRDLESRVRERTRLLAEATLQAREASRSKSEFLATMSHELRTPLNSVIGFSNVLLRRADRLEERDRDFLRRIKASGERLLELINDVLDLSRIDAGRLEIRPSATDVREVLDQAARRLADQARQRGLTLRVEGPEPGAVRPVLVDPVRLEQVLAHLGENALKFTPQGEVRLRLVAEDATAEAIEIRDTGIGIPEDRLEAVFEPFSQVESSAARRFEGTGLGLSIARRLCSLMECTLEVESEVGVGTTFRIGLPPPFVEGPDVVAETLRDDAGREGRRVLVIDDEEDARALMVELLESLDCRAVTAATGVAGLRLARTVRPDLITLDLRMEGLDGWETLRALKRDPATRDIPVVVVSVIASESRGELLGPVDMIDKPVDRDLLAAAVRRNLEGRPSRVLVVDDDPDVRRLYEELLDGKVGEVRSAENGRRALEVLEAYDPGLILLDLVMPEMDGFAFLRRLREDERRLDTPVVVVTSKDLSPDEVETLEEATAGVVRKAGGDDALADLRSRLESYLEPV